MIQSVLIVGAGCVGQVFGQHLARAGATVSVFVRPHQRDQACSGFPLARLSTLRRRPATARFVPMAVHTDLAALQLQRFDQVYLTVASHALAGDWLSELVRATGDATLISLQPGRDDLQRVRDAGAAPGSVVAGSIGFLAYTAPLAGETRFDAPCTAYWLPPLTRCFFSGEAARIRTVIATLRRGRLPARTHPDVHHMMALPNALGMTYLLALESAGWSEHALRTGRLMPLYREAVREVATIVAHDEGGPALAARVAGSPAILRFGFAVARSVAPLPLEPYLQKHFTKVGTQTRQMIDAQIAHGRAASLPVAKLEELLACVGEPRGASEPAPGALLQRVEDDLCA